MLAKLTDKVSWGDREGQPENAIAVDRDSLGLMAYEDGAEEDLED